MVNKFVSSSLLCAIILFGIITTAVSIESWDFIQEAEAQLDSQAQTKAEADIKKVSDALAAAGLNGTPSNLINTGDGFAQFFRDANGAVVFVVFWTQSTGAHAVSCAIMQTYKTEGWHVSDLGYPTSDEKDLAGVTDGRYNEFQKGVIAMIKGKNAEVFPTVKDAVAKLSLSKSPSLAEAEIKKVSDALAAAGLNGTPSKLFDTGEGFAQFFRDANGAIVFAVFWTPNTGAHAVSGAIMQTYKTEGWHLSDIGYPTSDEKDLAGVTDGRYNEFQKGVIAMIKGQSGQVFPTVEDAVAKLKSTTPVVDNSPKTAQVKLKFLYVDVFDDNEGTFSGDGEFQLFSDITSNGGQIVRTPPYCSPQHGDCQLKELSVANGLWDVSNGERVPFQDIFEIIYTFDKEKLTCAPNSGPCNYMQFQIETRGFEDDAKNTDFKNNEWRNADFWKTIGATIFSNDDDKLEDLVSQIILPFPSKYGTEQQQFIAKNGDYQLTWSTEVVASPP